MRDSRYFIVSFTGIDNNSKLRRGTIQMSVEDGRYVNEEYVQEQVKQMYGLKTVLVQHITELSEDDFLDFTATEDGSDGNFLDEFL